MAIATAKKIFQSLPSDFDDIIEKFAEEQRMEAALTLSDMVRSGSVEQYRQYFVQSPRGLSLEDEFETATEKPPIPEKPEIFVTCPSV